MSKHRIRELNDAFRQTFIGGRVLATPGVRSLPLATNALLLERVRTFTEFTPDNDPHPEHDFGSIEIEGGNYFWKIDYYDSIMVGGSEDPNLLAGARPMRRAVIMSVCKPHRSPPRRAGRGSAVPTPPARVELGTMASKPARRACRRRGK